MLLLEVCVGVGWSRNNTANNTLGGIFDDPDAKENFVVCFSVQTSENHHEQFVVYRTKPEFKFPYELWLCMTSVYIWRLSLDDGQTWIEQENNNPRFINRVLLEIVR